MFVVVLCYSQRAVARRDGVCACVRDHYLFPASVLVKEDVREPYRAVRGTKVVVKDCRVKDYVAPGVAAGAM